MFSGVSGLRVHQTKMDVIGNNIANVNTVGYKSQRVTFNEVFSQTVQTASAASDETGRGGRNPMQIGLGVNVSSIDLQMSTGASQRTDNAFDLMIDGDGFLIVEDNGQKYFTRAGAIRQDADGNLVIANGMKLQGWGTTVNDAGETVVQRGEVQSLSISASKTIQPAATTKNSISGNINPNDSPIETQIKFYDSLGNYYSMKVELTKGTTTGNQTKWTITPVDNVLTDDSNNTITVASINIKGGDLNFDSDGNIVIDPKNPITVEGLNLSNVTINGTTGQTINATIGNPVGTVTVDVSGITQYNSKTNLDPKTTDGVAAGQLSGFDIGGDGIIRAYYDNGNTKILGQVVVAEFDNAAGLSKVGDNLFAATANSGEFDNIGKAGNLLTGVLEMSNVDLSSEFSEMIITQRGFQANSRIFSVSDEMLQELVNLKR
jgi:flagellar hook protein FlgE